MNYNCLVFRKDKRGIVEFADWSKKASSLMQAFLYAQRQEVNGETCFFCDDTWFPEKKVHNAFDIFFSIYRENLDRGYDIGRLSYTKDDYSLGSFSDDYENCELNCSDFSLDDQNQPKEKFSLFDNSILVEVYENGCILLDVKSETKYFYSLKDINFFKSFKEFPLEMEIVAKINTGKLEKKQKYKVLDGISTNRLPGNLLRVNDNQDRLLKYSSGYVTLKKHYDTGRCIFIPEFWYKGRCYQGRECDNEPEAICESYLLEHLYSKEDEQYLFNPIFYRRYNQDALERYVKGEITELGLQREILKGLAHNPFLILRYNLMSLCRKFCIYIYPFRLDEEGFMINGSGTRYSELAEKVFSGVLSSDEIHLQHLL